VVETARPETKGAEMKSKWVCALLVAVLATGVYAANVLATPQSDVSPPPPAPKTTILATSVVGELHLKARTIPANEWQLRLGTRGLSDAYVVDNTFAPGATTGWHSHPGPSLIFVRSGSVTNHSSDEPGCAGQTYKAGDSFVDEGGDHVHMLGNPSTTETAETIAVQILPQGAPRKTDADEPKACDMQ
jgi:quercetin dioxygenase-like cupin family protein